MKHECPDCGEALIPLKSTNIKLCSGCKVEWNWSLDEGQLPLLGSHRQRATKQGDPSEIYSK